MRTQAERWWPRCLLLVLSAAVFAVHAVALLAPAQASEPHPGVAAAVVASDASPCEQGHLPDGAHESCADHAPDDCASTLTGVNGAVFDAADNPACTGAPASTATGRPHTAEQPVSLAQLQVWRH